MLNKTLIIGHLGKDPEVRTLNNGSKVSTFSIASTEKYKNKNGETVSNTEWFDCECWEKLADVAEQYLKKGSLVYIEGKQKTEAWEKDGEKRSRKKIRVNTIQMLGKSNEGHENKPQTQNNPPVQSEPEGEVDGLPF